MSVSRRLNPARLAALVRRAKRVAAVQRRRTETWLRRLARLRPSLATSFYAMGELLVRLRDAGAASTFEERNLHALARARAGLSRRDVADLMGVAQRLRQGRRRHAVDDLRARCSGPARPPPASRRSRCAPEGRASSESPASISRPSSSSPAPRAHVASVPKLTEADGRRHRGVSIHAESVTLGLP